MNGPEHWERFNKYLCTVEALGLQLDISRMSFDEDFLSELDGPMKAALQAMDTLESGALANRTVPGRCGRVPTLTKPPLACGAFAARGAYYGQPADRRVA